MKGDDTFSINYIRVSNMDKLLELDSLVFAKEHQIDEQVTRNRLQVNDETDIGVFDGEILMGYISLYPIPKRIYNEITTGSFDESKVELNTQSYHKPGIIHTYLCGIVINKKKYPRFKGRFLIEQLQKHIARLRKRGVFIKSIIAHAVSIAGRKTVEKMGFKEIRPNIFAYDCFKQGIIFLKKGLFFNPCLYRSLSPKLVDV